jgi:hypothetical protein
MLFHRFSLLYSVGFGAVGWGTFCWFKAHRASGWPLVPGIVHACEVKQSLDVDVGTMYRAQARYSYRVHDQIFQGSRLAFGYSSSQKYGEHAALCDKLGMAESISIRYNPANPAESVLTYGLNPYIVRIILFGLIWISFVTGFTRVFSFRSTAWTPELKWAILLPLLISFILWVFTRNTNQAMLERIEVQ